MLNKRILWETFKTYAYHEIYEKALYTTSLFGNKLETNGSH